MTDHDIVCPACGSRSVSYNQARAYRSCLDCHITFTPDGNIIPRRIFLSYGHDEYASFAIQLKRDLEEHSCQVWFDIDQLLTGADWEIHIENGFEWVSDGQAQGCFVLLMTPHSVRRPDGFCLNEIARAVSRRLSIIPVMLSWSEPPLSICRLQWLDMQDCVPLPVQREHYQLKLEHLLKALDEDKVEFEIQHTRLLHILNPLEFSADVAKHVARFTGREWLLNDLNAWLADSGASRVFWITGGPGAGKTALAAYLCHTRSEAVAFHFCQYGHDDKSDPRRCLMSLAYQLGSQIPEYQERLAAMDLNAEVVKSVNTLFDNLIVQPLFAIGSRVKRTMLIIIDALDEATHNDHNELAEFIATRFEYTPAWLRLVITSRPTRAVTVPMQSLSPYHLETDCIENLQDIRVFLRKELVSVPGFEKGEESAIETILSKSRGSFLYVERVLLDLKAGRMQLAQTASFPQGLGGIFQQFFSRQFPDANRYQTNHRPVIEMIIAARAPLPVTILRDAFQWDEYQLQQQLDSLGALFPSSDSSVQPFHQAVIDWITDAELAGHYFVDMTAGHRQIADYCWSRFMGDNDNMSSYCLTHLPTHLVELNRWKSLLLLVTSPRQNLITRWIQNGYDRGLQYLNYLANHLQPNTSLALQYAGIATQIARMHSMRGEYDNSHKWLQHAIDITSWRHGRRIKAVALHELASLYLYEGNSSRSSKLYRKALRLCLWGLPIHHDEAAANLIGLASIARANMRFTKTMRLAKRAIHQSQSAGDYHHVIAGKRMIGTVYNTTGDYTRAQAYLEEAIALCDSHDEHLEKARLLLVLGSCCYRAAVIKGELSPEAKSCYEQALVEAELVNDYYCRSEAKLSLGLYAVAEGNDKAAEEWLAPLRNTLQHNLHTELRAGIEFSISALAHLRGDLLMAKQGFQEVLDKWSGYSSTFRLQWRCRTLVGLGGIFWYTNAKEQANETWAMALDNAGRISQGERLLTEVRIHASKVNPQRPLR